MEISAEEKKAKEYFKKYISDFEKRIGKKLTTEFNEQLKVLLNQVEKQQKEIKKEKSRIMELAELLDKQESEIESLHQELEIQKGCSISKEKIREKIKELEKLYNCNLDTVLTSYEMFVFVRSYIDKVKNILNQLLEEDKC